MEPRKSTVNYFKELSTRSRDYFDAFYTGKAFVEENKVTSTRQATSCVLLSILWCAQQRGDELDEQDVCMYLNIDATNVKEGDVSVKLADHMKDWSLDQVLSFAKNHD